MVRVLYWVGEDKARKEKYSMEIGDGWGELYREVHREEWGRSCRAALL